MTSYFGNDSRERLRSWFGQHARNPRMEIESRVKDVTQAGFEAVLAHLQSHTGWSNRPAEVETMDKMHQSGVRETVDAVTKRRNFLRKGRVEDPLQVQPTQAHAVRFAVASENECAPDDSRVTTWRRKRRFSFIHKGMFAFDLTRVNQGTTEQLAFTSPVIHEIEIEFCARRS